MSATRDKMRDPRWQFRKCRWFNGVMNDKCEAGVAYASVRGDPEPGKGFALPCFPESGRPCEMQSFLTEDEITIRVEQMKENTSKFLKACEAAHAHAAAKGFRKGNGGTATLACPVCGTGTLGYRVSSYNGHMHAKCSTQGCVMWME